MEKIKDQLIKEHMKTFDTIAALELDESYGTPPQVYYITIRCKSAGSADDEDAVRIENYRYEIDPEAHKSAFAGQLRRKLRHSMGIMDGTLEAVELEADADTQPFNGMFYKEGIDEITIYENRNIIEYYFQIGPKYGRTVEYKIIDKNGEKALGTSRTIRIS